jgi:micrococcal nuclease
MKHMRTSAAYGWPLVIGLGCAVAVAAPAGDSEPEACTLQRGERSTVARIIDGETLVLESGAEVRLIGALAPRALEAGAIEGTWQPEHDSKAALEGLAAGKRVQLAYGARRTDRYGRKLAHVFLVDSTGREEWLQGAMLLGGHARAYGLPDNFACSRALLAHEAEARREGRGLWAFSAYGVRNVAKTKNAMYLNFGDDWRRDFTAQIGRDARKQNPALEATLEKLKGRQVIVRGWIERRNGPLIDIADPSQLEILSDAPASVSAAPSWPGTREPAGADGGNKKQHPEPSLERIPGAIDL